jgi:hypothetical protein
LETKLTVAGATLPLTTRSVSSTDVDLASFLVTVELAVASVYGTAAVKVGDAKASTLARTFAAQHQDHASAWAGVAGSKAVRRPNPLLLRATMADIASATPAAALGVLYALEDRLAATYQYTLERLLSDAHLELAASILPVECQHAVVFGTLIGKKLKELIPVDFETPDGFIDPALFPVTG